MGEPMKNEIQLFEDQKIRVAWDAEREEWYFSIVDVVGVLTDSPDYNTGRKYWNKLKQRLKDEGNELVTNCHQLKMRAAEANVRMRPVTSSRDPMTMRTCFLPTRGSDPDPSSDPTSVPEQRYSMKSSSSSVSRKAIRSLATLTKIIGTSGMSRRKRIHAKSSDQERNSAMMKSAFSR